MFADNIRSAKRMAERLRDAACFAAEEAFKANEGLFGAVEKATREDVLNKIRGEYGNQQERANNLGQQGRHSANGGDAERHGEAGDSEQQGRSRCPTSLKRGRATSNTDNDNPATGVEAEAASGDVNQEACALDASPTVAGAEPKALGADGKIQDFDEKLDNTARLQVFIGSAFDLVGAEAFDYLQIHGDQMVAFSFSATAATKGVWFSEPRPRGMSMKSGWLSPKPWPFWSVKLRYSPIYR